MISIPTVPASRRLAHLAVALSAAFVLFITSGVSAKSPAGLSLSKDKINDGDVQTLMLSLDETMSDDVVDVYILLSGSGRSVRSLKADGTFTAPGMIAPRLRGERVSQLKASTELVTLRLTGLPVGGHKWTVGLTKRGSRFGRDTTTFSARFTVEKSAGPLFVELAEGRDGVVFDGAKRRAIAAAAKTEPYSRARGGGATLSKPTPSAAPAPMIASPGLPSGLGGVRDASTPDRTLAHDARAVGAPPPVAPATARSSRYSSSGFAAADPSRPRPTVKKMSAKPGEARMAGLADADDGIKDAADAPADEIFRAPDALLGELKMKGKVEAGGRVVAADAEAEGARLLDAAELKKAVGEIEKAKTLTAGATDDNKDFGDFLTFLKDRNSPAVMCQDIAQRRFITVLDSQGRHVSNADVAIKKGDELLFAGRTLANGQTLFCPGTVPQLKAGKHTLDIKVAKGLVSRSWSVDLNVVQDAKLKNKFDPKKMPEQPMPIDIMPLPGCAVGHKPMARDARAAAAPAALRALETAPVALSADALDLLGEDVAAAFKDTTLDPVPRLAPERVKTVPKGDWVLRLPGKLPVEAPKIDLVFQIDTTGSMRDEIRAVQATLQSVAKRIDSMDPRPTVRWGLVLYGDRGDTYVVRRYNFTPDVNELHDWVLNMAMTGGGDTPESALEALHASVNEMAWDSGDAIRLVFLIADARPHLDYSRPYTYVDKMKEAVAKGIKIIPTAASGLDKTGEYIFRQWAQGTMGKFLYITYGAGGAGGKAGTSEHEVKQPKKKNNLDDLIVKAVADELANWRSPTLYDSGEKKIERPKFTVRKAE